MFQQINVNMQHTPSCHKEVGDYLESLFVGSRKYTLRKLRHVVVEKGTLFEFAADKRFHQFEPNINHLEFIGTHINKDFVTFSLSSCFPTLERLTFNGCFFSNPLDTMHCINISLPQTAINTLYLSDYAAKQQKDNDSTFRSIIFISIYSKDQDNTRYYTAVDSMENSSTMEISNQYLTQL
jgi:hypothetical protein